MLNSKKYDLCMKFVAIVSFLLLCFVPLFVTIGSVSAEEIGGDGMITVNYYDKNNRVVKTEVLNVNDKLTGLDGYDGDYNVRSFNYDELSKYCTFTIPSIDYIKKNWQTTIVDSSTVYFCINNDISLPEDTKDIVSYFLFESKDQLVFSMSFDPLHLFSENFYPASQNKLNIVFSNGMSVPSGLGVSTNHVELYYSDSDMSSIDPDTTYLPYADNVGSSFKVNRIDLTYQNGLSYHYIDETYKEDIVTKTCADFDDGTKTINVYTQYDGVEKQPVNKWSVAIGSIMGLLGLCVVVMLVVGIVKKVRK